MADLSYTKGIAPRNVEILEGFGQILGDRVLVYIDNANVTETASDTWSKTINFRIIGEDSGLVLPLNQTVGAAVSLTNGSGPVPAVSTATPSVVWGSGSVTVSAGNVAGGSYVATDVATLTITYTNLRGGTDTDTWTITMS